MSRELKEKYEKHVKPALQKQFSFANPNQVPKVLKVVIHMGLAEAAKDKNAVVDALADLAALSGQKPILVRSKKAISNFKLRLGQPIGGMVTLRRKRMYDFLYRFFNIVCPRIRDFRGFNTKCDGQGNFSLGLTEQHIFPEVDLDKRAQGMNINFVTSARTDEECFSLLEGLGLPFKRPEKRKQ